MKNKIFWLMGLSAFLIIFCKSWEPGIGISSTTYGAIAKNFAHNHNWFHLFLAPRLFDPFIEHPPLAIWLDGIIFNLLGVSAQTLRLLGSFMGLAVFMCLFSVLRRRFDETTAVLGVIGLFTINVFMNFISSGWLDMPMVGFTWLGFACLDKDLREDKPWTPWLAGFFLSCAVLAKGVSALAVGPVLIWFAIMQKRRIRTLYTSAAFILPILLFTYLFYRATGIFFWKAYLFKQVFVHNQVQEQMRSIGDFSWYLTTILKHAHVMAIAAIFGLIVMRKSRSANRDLFWLILAQFFLHAACYSASSRHYPQYVIPLFPWLMLAAAVALRTLMPRLPALKTARVVAVISIVFFVALDLLPIRIHFGNENGFRPLSAVVDSVTKNDHVYFIGAAENQDTWEAIASYIAWYWDRTPIPVTADEMMQKLSQQDTNAIGIWSDERPKELLARYPNVKICVENDEVQVLANVNLCTNEVIRQRPREPRKQVFSR